MMVSGRLTVANCRCDHSSNALWSGLTIMFQADSSVRHYTGEPGYYRGESGGRGGRGYIIMLAT